MNLSLKSICHTAFAFTLSTFAFHAEATPVNIPNPSFELSGPIQSSTDVNLAPGWVFRVTDGSAFGIASIPSNFSSPGPSSGSNYAFINNDAPGLTETITSANSLGLITPLTTYTLTVAIGNRNGSDSSLYDAPGNVAFSLLANGVPFVTKEVTNGTVPNGAFEDFALTFTTPAVGAFIGQSLTVQLAAMPEAGSAFQPAFDNVRLNADSPGLKVVPELSTWALFACGLLFLVFIIRPRTAGPKFAAAIASLVLSAVSAHAAAINVPNASFETPGTTAQSSTRTNIIPDWLFSDTGGITFGTKGIASNFSSHPASLGNDFAFIDNNAKNTKETITSATSLGPIASDTTYTLSVDVGNVKAADAMMFGDVGNVSLSLLANGIPFATKEIANGSVANGTFEDFTLSYTTPVSGSIIGENLTIQFASLAQTGVGNQAAFDNVTLDATSLDVSDPPVALEPPAWAPILSGVLSLGWLTRRRFAFAR